MLKSVWAAFSQFGEKLFGRSYDAVADVFAGGGFWTTAWNLVKVPFVVLLDAASLPMWLIDGGVHLVVDITAAAAKRVLSPVWAGRVVELARIATWAAAFVFVVPTVAYNVAYAIGYTCGSVVLAAPAAGMLWWARPAVYAVRLNRVGWALLLILRAEMVWMRFVAAASVVVYAARLLLNFFFGSLFAAAAAAATEEAAAEPPAAEEAAAEPPAAEEAAAEAAAEEAAAEAAEEAAAEAAAEAAEEAAEPQSRKEAKRAGAARRKAAHQAREAAAGGEAPAAA